MSPSDRIHTFTRAQLVDAFRRWSAACPKDAQGKFADPAGSPEDSAAVLLRYLDATD